MPTYAYLCLAYRYLSLAYGYLCLGYGYLALSKSNLDLALAYDLAIMARSRLHCSTKTRSSA